MELTKDTWECLIFVPNGVPSVRARCCETMIWYEYPGDEWCNEHRCTVITKLLGTRCSRKASIGDECSQHFHRGLKATLV
jgi:hypothetical protein